MNDYTKDMVSDSDPTKMDREEYAAIVKAAWNYGYDMENDISYEGEEKWCK